MICAVFVYQMYFRIILACRLRFCRPPACAAESSRPDRNTLRRIARRWQRSQRIANAGIDPSLHFDKLAQSEDVEYSGSGRNIFSAESVPIAIPDPLKQAREHRGIGGAPHARRRRPSLRPSICATSATRRTNTKQLKAFFMHGDDIFMARTGDIVDHRYKVGVIHPLNVEVTDLAYNNTQVIEISQQ